MPVWLSGSWLGRLLPTKQEGFCHINSNLNSNLRLSPGCLSQSQHHNAERRLPCKQGFCLWGLRIRLHLFVTDRKSKSGPQNTFMQAKLSCCWLHWGVRLDLTCCFGHSSDTKLNSSFCSVLCSSLILACKIRLWNKSRGILTFINVDEECLRSSAVWLEPLCAP